MKKILLIILGVILLTGCGQYLSNKDKQEIRAIDGMVYTFIVGKVEGNDDLLKEVLAPDAQEILKPGRHAYPDNAIEMGDRFMIKRYQDDFHEGMMVYEVRFYRPNTGKDSYYIIPVVNTDEGWRIGSNTSYPSEYLKMIKLDKNGEPVEGIEVHEYKE